MAEDNAKNSDDEIWSLGEESEDLSEEERIAKAEKEADRNYDERKERERESLARMKWEREHPDSREDHDWSAGTRQDETVNGQKTKTQRIFPDPQSRIFNSSGNSNIFRTAENKRRVERYLGRELRSTVSSRNRKAYLDILENFKDARTGFLSRQDIREANRAIRSGEAGNKPSTQRAIETMKQKGIINSAKDLTKMVGRSAMRQMGNFLMRPNDQGFSARPSRDRGSDASDRYRGMGPSGRP